MATLLDKTGIVRNAGVLDSSYKIPGGGITSSPNDMANFEAAILGDKLLKRSARDLMWSFLKTADGKETLQLLPRRSFAFRLIFQTIPHEADETAYIVSL